MPFSHIIFPFKSQQKNLETQITLSEHCSSIGSKIFFNTYINIGVAKKIGKLIFHSFQNIARYLRPKNETVFFKGGGMLLTKTEPVSMKLG